MAYLLEQAGMTSEDKQDELSIEEIMNTDLEDLSILLADQAI